MAFHQATGGPRAASVDDLVRIVVIIGAAILVMVALTAILGVQFTGPAYETAPDPATGLSLPF